MKKLLKIITGVTLSLAMAIGVGIGVASNKEAKPVHASVGSTVTIGSGSYRSSYETGFESCTAGTTYNSTQTYNTTVGEGVSWSVYYGTVSTNAKLTGTKSMQMRWYSSAKTNYPHAETTSPISSVKAFKFNYAVGNTDLDFVVQYSTNGTSWTDIETVDTDSTSATEYSHEFDNKIQNFYFRVLVCLGTAPSSGNYTFRIDDIVFGSVALSNIALSGDYPTSFTQGDSFSHEGMTVTATYGDSSTTNVTASSTFSGYNMSTVSEQTVTVTYTENSITKTTTYNITVSEPTLAYINLELTSGNELYTGQTIAISASFGNGVAGLNWTVENGTVSSASSSDSGYSATATSSGTLTIRATDTNSALYSEVSVSVTQTTISINKTAISIGRNSSETLVATVNVGTVDWSSNNAKVTVSSAGVVSVAANAIVGSMAIITARSHTDSSVSATCTVTVLYYSQETISVVPSGLSGAYGSNEEKTFNGVKFNVNNVANFDTNVQFKKDATAGLYNKDAFRISISKIEFAFNSSNTATLVNGQSESKGALKVLFSANSDFSDAETIQVQIAAASTAELVTISPTIERAVYAKILSNNIAAVYCDSIVFTLVTLDSYFDSVTPVKTAVTNPDSSVALRFGARILKTDWAAIHAKAVISDYGVMLFREKDEPESYSDTPVLDAYNASKTLTVGHKGNGTAPGTEGDYYEFTVKINFTVESNKSVVFCAAPFIVAGGQYYFLCEIQTTYNELMA